MPQVYHVDLAQHAASADARWVDNLISRFVISGVEGSGRGSSRRLSLSAIHEIALIRTLTADLGIPLTSAVPVAQSLLSGKDVVVAVGPWLRIEFNRFAFLQEINELVADGVEAMTPVRRGRPPSARTAG